MSITWQCVTLLIFITVCTDLFLLQIFQPGFQQIPAIWSKNRVTKLSKKPTQLSTYLNSTSISTTDSIRGRNATVSTLPSFHKEWKVNCTKILQGNEEEIKHSVQLLNVSRHDPKLPTDPFMPTDTEVQTWTKDCDLFKRARNYPTQSPSVEETDFPLAYIIVVHQGSAQVERLLRAIYQPKNVYCVHPDQKSPDDFKNAINSLVDCFENVFIPSKTEHVTFAGYTRLLADINCMRDLTGPRAFDYPWKYVINLSGQDFPLKSNLEIVRKLKSYNGHNDVIGYLPGHKAERTLYHHKVMSGYVEITTERKKPAPHNFRVLSGSAYYFASRRFVNYVLTNQTVQDLLEWTNDTYSPEETFWATLQYAPGTPGGKTTPSEQSSVRYVLWIYYLKGEPKSYGRDVRSVCVFALGHLQYFTSVQELFVNKFDYAYDPIALQCSEEALEARAVRIRNITT